eukprot:TRINITY_DN15417_c0_g1_i1.p1 TRINITY_DN15417_c0_g1~~TRINITY_DN15417_c0_g1_i1.p1  ORF type:complete len:820 (-),score=106.13 TRINITY_DN15417_c0_g1_i1:42-2501(-)
MAPFVDSPRVRCWHGAAPHWPAFVILLMVLARAASGSTFDIISGNVDVWNPRGGNSKCLVQMALAVEAYAGSGGGLLFTPPSHDDDLDVFTLTQREVRKGSFLLDGGASASGGLKLTFTGIGDNSTVGTVDGDNISRATEASPWRIVLRYDDSKGLAFLGAFEVKPGGPHSVFLPWSAFSARLLKSGVLWMVKENLNPSLITVAGVSEPQHKSMRVGGEVTRLVLHKAEVSPPMDGVKVPVELDSSGKVFVEQECLCNASCARFRLEYAATRSSGYCTWGTSGGRGVKASNDGSFLDTCLAVLRGPTVRLASGLSKDSCPTWTDSTPGVTAGTWLLATAHAEAFVRVCSGPFFASRLISDMVYSVLISGDLPSAPSRESDEKNTTGFFGPMVGKGISGRNDLRWFSNVSIEECLQKCQDNALCRSVDYGARDSMQGRCYLSTSDRESAWGLYEEWPLFDYYEKPVPVATRGFHGPWKFMGISGRNDLEGFKNLDIDACLAKCQAERRCRSVDFGARGKATGECWLSTGNRRSDPTRFTYWKLYDYYEAPQTAAAPTSLELATSRSEAEKQRLRDLAPQAFDPDSCCSNPVECVKVAIRAGAPLFNIGETLGCYWIYHNAASNLKGCPSINSDGTSWLGTVFRALVAGASATMSPPEAAWVIRGAFDALLAVDACGAKVAEDLSDTDPLLDLLGAAEVESEDVDEVDSFEAFSDDRSQYKSPPPQVIIRYVDEDKSISEEKTFPILIIVILIVVILVIALIVVAYLLVRLRRKKSGGSDVSNPNVVVGRPVEEADDVEVADGTNLSVPVEKDDKTAAKEP